VPDQAWHPHKTKRQFKVLYTLYVWLTNQKTEDSAPNDGRYSSYNVCSSCSPLYGTSK
jgi:hypothetical protein